MVNKELTYERALQRVQALCARQERCSDDIRKKLIQWNVSSSNINKIIKGLVVDGFINDERFALMFARDKSKLNKWGPLKIAYALKSKHFPEEVIKKAISEVDNSKDKSILVDILTKKLKSVKAKSPYDLRQKLFRFGVSRGFEIEQINKALSTIVKD